MFALEAQTWVSGVGDDANPCTRTAPCKTFAGAISKTEAGGVISVLDPGGFGAVTITKSITIDANGEFAGVLVSGTNGIVVSAPGASVTLRGLTIEYVAPCTAPASLDGIRLLAGSLNVQDVAVRGFPGDAVNAVASGEGSSLSVTGSDLRENCTGGVAASTTAGHVSVSVSGDFISDNATGVVAEAGAQVTLSDNTIVDNTTGLVSGGGGTLSSTGNNRIVGNATNGAAPVELVSPFAPPPPSPVPSPVTGSVSTPTSPPLPPTCTVRTCPAARS